MPDQGRRLQVILDFVKKGDPEALKRAIQQLEQAVKDFGTQGAASAQKVSALEAQIKKLQAQLTTTHQQGNNLAKSFSKAGDAAYHFGMGAMWLNIPVARFVYVAGNLIQGLQWMHKGFMEVIKDLDPLTKKLIVGTVAVTGIGLAMAATTRQAMAMVDAIRRVGEATGQHMTAAARSANELSGALGMGGSQQSSIVLARMQSSMNPAERALQTSQAMGVRPGQTGEYFQSPFSQIGVPLFERGGKQRSATDVFVGAAQRLLQLDEKTRARQLNRFDPDTGEKLAMVMELLKKESPETLKARGTGLFEPSEKDKQNLIEYKLASIELKNTWDSFMAEVGKDLIPLLTAFLKLLVGGARAVRDFSGAIGGGIPLFGLMAGAALLLMTRVGGVIRIFGPLTRLLGKAGPLGAGITAVSGLLTGDLTSSIVGVIGLVGPRLVPALLLGARGFLAFLGPIGWAVLVVSSLVIGLKLLWPALKPFAEAIGSLWTKLKEFDIPEWAKKAKKGWDDFGSGLGGAIGRVMAFLEAIRQLASEAAKGSMNFAVNLVTGGGLPDVRDRQVNWDVLLKLRSEPQDALDVLAKIQPKTVDVNAILKLQEQPVGAIEALQKIQPRTVDVNAILKLQEQPRDAIAALAKIQTRTEVVTVNVRQNVDLTTQRDQWYLEIPRTVPKTIDLTRGRADWYDELTKTVTKVISIESLLKPSPSITPSSRDSWYNDLPAQVTKTVNLTPNLTTSPLLNTSRDDWYNDLPRTVLKTVDLVPNTVVNGARDDWYRDLPRTVTKSIALTLDNTGRDTWWRQDANSILLKTNLDLAPITNNDLKNKYPDLRLKMGVTLPSEMTLWNALPPWARPSFAFPSGNPISVPAPFGATGAVVNRPTLAWIGERGREAVVPLERSSGNESLLEGLGGRRGGGMTVNNYFTISAMDFSDPAQVERVARKVGDRIVQNVRILTGGGRVP